MEEKQNGTMLANMGGSEDRKDQGNNTLQNLYFNLKLPGHKIKFQNIKGEKIR